MALEDVRSVIFNNYKQQEENSIVENIKKITQRGQDVSETLEALQAKQKNFLEQYETIANYLSFENEGILTQAGLDVNDFYALSKDEQKKLLKSKEQNLLSPTGLSRILARDSYDINYSEDGTLLNKQLNKYFHGNEELLKNYISSYKELHNSMIEGYKTLIKIGQGIRGVQEDNFSYVVGFFKKQGLEHLLTLTESEMNNFMNDYRFFGTSITQSGDLVLGFNQDINRKDAFNAMKNLINNREEQLIQESELIKSFSFLKDANITSLNSGQKITSNARLLEVLVSNGIVEQLQNNGNIIGYKMHMENLSLLSGADIMFDGYEKSVKSIKGSGHNADFVGYSTLVKGLSMFASEESIRTLVQESIKAAPKEFTNKSEFEYKKVEEAADEATDEVLESESENESEEIGINA